jgi:hypothetical protein
VTSALAAVVDSDPTATSVPWTLAKPFVPFLRVDSKFAVQNPTQTLTVGDFDGDGRDDLFLSTGSGWYYAPAANAEWRLLSAKTETSDSLLFGDFDGDGRTDVFIQKGDDWLVSWAGRSEWKVLSRNHGTPGGNPIEGMMNFVIGDFVGDKRADVFYADGANWYVSDGGVSPFVLYATSSFKIPDLAFGDFDGDGKVDIVGVVANQWMIVHANQEHIWKPLRAKQSNTMKGFIVADFDGNGKSDIARLLGTVWQVSRDGTGDWSTLTSLPGLTQFAGVGRFDDNKGADILVWNGNSLDARSAGTGTPQRQSRQNMR